MGKAIPPHSLPQWQWGTPMDPEAVVGPRPGLPGSGERGENLGLQVGGRGGGGELGSAP